MSYENFAYYYDSLMDEQFYDDYFQFINHHADFKSVLELGCGTGEIALRLAQNDKEIYATDLSKDMLEVARLKAINANVNLMLGRVDMTDFKTDRAVDLIICLCDSINYVLSKKKVRQTFKNVYESLKYNGTFIFDANSLYKIEEVLDGYFEEEDEEDFYFKWAVKKTAPGKVEHLVEIIDKDNNEHIKEFHHQQTYSINEYLSMLEQAGFNEIEYYGEFEEYHQESQRIIFVCHKRRGCK